MTFEVEKATSKAIHFVVQTEKSKTLRASASANSHIFACMKVLFILRKSLASHRFASTMVRVTLVASRKTFRHKYQLFPFSTRSHWF